MPTKRICAIDGCSKPTLALGLCVAHYTRLRRYGDPLGSTPPRAKPACSVADCGNQAGTRDLCRGHYQRWRRHGNVFADVPLKETSSRGAPLKFIHEVAVRYTGDECLIWPLGKANYGYGEVLVDGQKRLAHRVVCELVHGKPPKGKNDAAHRCGNRLCVNPFHLRWASRAENVEDMIAHGTALRGEKGTTARLTERDVREIRALKGKMPQKEVADKFGITPKYVGEIQSRRASWSWLKD
jgi:hypothetical protein